MLIVSSSCFHLLQGFGDMQQRQEAFLSQLEGLLGLWDTVGGQSSEIELALSRIEMCRSVLALFVPSSGIFKGILGKVVGHLFHTIDLLEKLCGGGVFDKSSAQSASILNSNVSPETLADDVRSARLDRQLQYQETIFGSREAELMAVIEKISRDRDKLAELLQFQETRRHRTLYPMKDVPPNGILIAQLSDERDIVSLTERKEVLDHQNQQLVNQVAGLKTLNGKYAVQATELAARLLVVQEHNERVATTLAIQQEELLRLEKENAVLKSELSDFSSARNFPKLMDSEEVVAETRSVSYGFGSNLTVPKHLQGSELIGKFRMTKETAVLTVHDILVTRHSQRGMGDFSSHVASYFSKRHGPQGVSWAYGLDECTRLYDSDFNLNAFGQVSRKVLPEKLYSEVDSDIVLFLRACDSLDRRANHDNPKQILATVQILMILYELYPSYSEEGLRRLMSSLEGSTVSSNVHYQMLFPNMDRLSLIDMAAPVSSGEVRPENSFSNTFKELILDDAVTTVQLVVDALLALPGNKVSMIGLGDALQGILMDDAVRTEMSVLLRAAFDSVVHRAAGPSDLTVAHLGPDVAVPKGDMVHYLRTHVVLRRGVLRGSTHEKPLLCQYLEAWQNANVESIDLLANFDVQRRRPTIGE